MKKLIFFIILFSSVLCCFSSCNNKDNENNDANEESSGGIIELNEIFNLIKVDSLTNDKIFFYTGKEELHYELKNSGLYNDSKWQTSSFEISIKCNYALAINEDWYKECSQYDIKTVNEALYTHLNSFFLNEEFINFPHREGLHFRYVSADNFYADYQTLKSITELEYVEIVEIGYLYGLPYDYMVE